APGNYSVRINDFGAGCRVREIVTVGQDITISNISSTNTPADCGASNGGVDVDATTTGGGLTFTLGGTTNGDGIFNGLAAGSYVVTIADDQGCSIDQNVVVPENTTVSIDSFAQTNSDCTSSTGSLVVNATGSGSITYTITYTVDGSMQTQVDNGTFNNLPGGAYDVVVTDANGCSDQAQTIVFENNDISVTGVNPTSPTNACSGDGSIAITANGTNVQFSIDNINFFGMSNAHTFTGLDAGIYIIYMRNDLGCTKETGQIELTGQIEITDVIITNTTCMENNGALEVVAVAAGIEFRLDGGMYDSSNMFTDLSAGTYVVWIRDENGCEESESVEIINEGFTEILDATPTQTICGDPNGTITVSATSITDSLGYSIDRVNYSNNNVFTDLASGTYTVYVSDEFSCIDSLEVVVPESFDIEVFDVVVTDEQCDFQNGVLEVQANGGTGTLRFSINGGPFQLSDTFEDLSNGSYDITVIDEVGCSVTVSRDVGINCEIAFPTAIAPNGNGVNELHRLLYYQPIEIIEYRVFDRWGQEVHTRENFTSTNASSWWRGANADGQVEQATYLFYIKYVFEGQEVEREGTVQVIR
ncbi:MAG: gliding motility-associated C-terminal domain-containing protein, partial [Saprospiraceae bacterium]|nr:gliding motility-associated C-terminal domain-containing protein [Saprospiraceae bacterium]